MSAEGGREVAGGGSAKSFDRPTDRSGRSPLLWWGGARLRKIGGKKSEKERGEGREGKKKIVQSIEVRTGM